MSKERERIKRPILISYTKFDIVDYLDTDETMVAYLRISAEDPDPEMFIIALGDVARAKGIKYIPKKTGLDRERLYKILRTGGNSSHTILRQVFAALNIKCRKAL